MTTGCRWPAIQHFIQHPRPSEGVQGGPGTRRDQRKRPYSCAPVRPQRLSQAENASSISSPALHKSPGRSPRCLLEVQSRVRFGANAVRPATLRRMPRPRTGTLTQRGPALWRLQVTSNADPGPGAELGAKRRLSRSFRGTKAKARAALQRLIVETGCDLHGGSTATVAVLLGQFMTTASLAPTTRADWQCVVDNHLVPALGDIPLWRLTARDCDALYGALKDVGLGPSRVRCTHVVLHRALAQAVRWGWLARNPASNATRPEVPRTTIHPPDAAAVRALIAQASTHDPDMACWLYVATATGARRGEVCGLRWGDIDFAQRSVRIERSVSATRAGVFVKATKTGGVRRVSITAQAVEALRDPLSTSGAQRSAEWPPRQPGRLRLHE